MSDQTSSKAATGLKIIALLSQLRWYNIGLMLLAQYLAAIFILNNPEQWQHTLMDHKLHLIVLSVLLLIAAGFLINNFYDIEKDAINRPQRTAFEGLVSKEFLLRSYFFLNISGALLAALISWRAFFFFSAYAFLIWFYSHKRKALPLLGNLLATFLVVLPFFGLLVYYQIENLLVIAYGFFFSWILFIRECIKDLQYYKGDMIYGYQTVPVVFGREKAVRFLKSYAALGILFATGVLFLDFGWATHTYTLIVGVSYIILFSSIKTTSKTNRLRLIHSYLKILILAGILIIPFLE